MDKRERLLEQKELSSKELVAKRIKANKIKAKKLAEENKATKKKIKESTPKIICSGCSSLLAAGYFYLSYIKLHVNGRIPYCKNCIKKMICDNNGNVSLINVQNTLQLLNKPFLYDIWISSLNAYGDTIGVYMKQLALPQFRKLTWKDSSFEASPKKEMNYTEVEKGLARQQIDNFEVTDEIILKWGFGYEDNVYQAFERKYQFLKNNYPEKTAMHTEALLNYIRYRVREELATLKVM